MMRASRSVWLTVFGLMCLVEPHEAKGLLPERLRAVLENTRPLNEPLRKSEPPLPSPSKGPERYSEGRLVERGGRLPFYVLPISGALAGVDDAEAENALRELDARGIGYTIPWNPNDFAASLAEGLRVGAMQQRLGMEVSVDATSCLHSYFDGSDATLHQDDGGARFAEKSFGGKLGCPFAIEHRRPVIKERVERFLEAYRAAGVAVDFVFADWEIDGPIEWNDAWATSRRCRVCREAIPRIDDFRQFQRQLRRIRAELQREALGDCVTRRFPHALVGNYGVYPHDGYRYWYDYFERLPEGVPYRQDQKARYRQWYPEFEQCGYTFAMPVVYTWYPTFAWYDFKDLDYRWFYNMLLVGSNAGRHTPHEIPIVSFVHWTTTAPPEQPDPAVEQFSAERYQQLLWHLLLRGHDTFFLWCLENELPQEVRLVHEVYAAALEAREFLDHGVPITFQVPDRPGTVVSGLRLGGRVLARRTDFSQGLKEPVRLTLADGGRIEVPSSNENQVLEVRYEKDDRADAPSDDAAATTHEPWRDNADRRHDGFLRIGGSARFPIGCYELPDDDAELRRMAAAGINIVRCANRRDLDRASAAGLSGWVPLAVQQGATENLRQQVRALADHPALAVWEGPDEIVWNFTAYSGLEKTAGYTRKDWERQTPRAADHAREQASKILPALAEGIALVRQLDPHGRPFWINEAADSDVAYVRGYIDSVDITGCDYYPIRSDGTDPAGIGRLVDRWSAIGRGRPVWMVLQAFSWHTAHTTRTRRYPTFAESRFMAYDSISRGARGIHYWGSSGIDEPEFRRSIYALTGELSVLQPYLISADHAGVRVRLIEDVHEPPSGRGVRACLRNVADQWLLILVNEDADRHLGVEIGGLEAIEGRSLDLLYGSETIRATNGALVTRLQGHEVKVFSTDPSLAGAPSDGRDYGVSSER